MSIFQIKNTQFKKDIVESLQLSQKDTILKCKDGQIPLSKFSLVMWSSFWNELLLEFQHYSEIEILLPDFDVATVMELIEFLRRGELANEGCPKNIQKIIYFVKALIPDIDIFSFVIEKLFNSQEMDDHDSDSDDNDFKSVVKQEQIIEDDDNDHSVEFAEVETGKKYETRHACKYCLKYFVTRQTLERHIKVIHLKAETFMCPRCGKSYNSKDGLKAHMKEHDDRNTKENICPDCGKIYKNLTDLRKHCRMSNHSYPKIETPDKAQSGYTLCIICNKWVRRVQHHMKKYHSEESRSFSCDYCEFTTNRRDTLYKHERVAHGMHYRDLNAVKTNFQSKGKMKCFDCGRKFETVEETEEHIIQGCIGYTCQNCGKTFNVRHNLLQHIREVHEKENKFDCPICKKCFNTKRSRDRHAKTCNKNNDL